MKAGKVAILLVYEPASMNEGPVPIARLDNHDEVSRVANAVLRAADERAQRLSNDDDLIGEIEKADAGRLRRILKTLLPTLNVDLEQLSEPYLMQ